MSSWVFQFPAYASLVADALIHGGRGQGIGVTGMLSNSVTIFAPYLAGLIIVRLGNNRGMRALTLVILLTFVIQSLVGPHGFHKVSCSFSGFGAAGWCLSPTGCPK